MVSHSQKLSQHPIWYFQIGIALSPSQCWEAAAFMCSRFSIKVGVNTQADLKVFFKDELQGHVPLISPEDVVGSRILDLRIDNSLCQCHLVQCQCMFLQCTGNLASFVCIYDIRWWHRLGWGGPRMSRHHCGPQRSWGGGMYFIRMTILQSKCLGSIASLT